MNSSLIGKIEKARRYATERTRMHVNDLNVSFHGENGEHTVTLTDGHWHCSCDFFAIGYGACAHTMALERVMEGMLPASAASPVAAAI